MLTSRLLLAACLLTLGCSAKPPSYAVIPPPTIDPLLIARMAPYTMPAGLLYVEQHLEDGGADVCPACDVPTFATTLRFDNLDALRQAATWLDQALPLGYPLPLHQDELAIAQDLAAPYVLVLGLHATEAAAHNYANYLNQPNLRFEPIAATLPRARQDLPGIHRIVQVERGPVQVPALAPRDVVEVATGTVAPAEDTDQATPLCTLAGGSLFEIVQGETEIYWYQWAPVRCPTGPLSDPDVQYTLAYVAWDHALLGDATVLREPTVDGATQTQTEGTLVQITAWRCGKPLVTRFPFGRDGRVGRGQRAEPACAEGVDLRLPGEQVRAPATTH